MKKLITTLLLALTTFSFVNAQTNLSQGGTGWTSSTVGQLLVGTSSSLRYSRFNPGTTGQVLQASSTSPFRMAWVSTSTLGISGTNLLPLDNLWTGLNSFNATSTLSSIISSLLRASSSAGIIFQSNNGTQIADFGAGGGSNATFSGGVTITGQTSLSTASTTAVTIPTLYNTTVAYIRGLLADSTNATGTLGNVLISTGTSTRWVATSSLGISGGSGNSAWTIGNSLIYNATATDFVGIGTTTARAKLDVTRGTANTDGNSSNVANFTGADVTLASSNGNISINTNTAQAADIGGGITFGGLWNAGTSNVNWATIKSGKTNSTSGNFSGYLAFGTRDNGGSMAEAMRIDNLGNIGIGTTTPSQKLQVQGGFRLTGQFNDSVNASGTLGQLLWSTGTSTLWVSTSSLGISGGAGVTGGVFGFATRWLSATTLGTSTLLDNGTVAGIGATSTALFTVSASTSTFPALTSGTNVAFIGQSANPFRMSFDTYSSANTFGSQLEFRRARGTSNAPTAVQANDTLFTLTGIGYGATGYPAVGTSFISSMAEGNFTNTSQPTNLRFFTTATSSITAIENMTLTGDGRLGIGTTSPIATMSVRGTTTVPIVTIASSTGAVVFSVNQAGLINMATTTVTGSSTFIQPVRMNSTLQIGGALSGVTTLSMGGALSGVTTAALSSTLTQTMTSLATSTLAATIRGFYAVNSTAATITQNQQSPAIELEGKVWEGSSRPANWRIQNTFPATSTTFATSSLDFTASLNNAATNTVLSLKASGLVGIGTTTPNATLTVRATSTNAVSGILNILTSLGTSVFNILSTGQVLFGTSTVATCGATGCGLTVATTTQFTAGVVSRVVGYTWAASTTINLNTTDIATSTLTSTTTLVNPTGTAYDGQMFQFAALATGTRQIFLDTQFATTTGFTSPITVASGTTYYLFQRSGFRGKWEFLSAAGPYN